MSWLKTAEVAKALDMHPQTLRKLKREGWLKIGIHYRSQSSPNASKPRLQWHFENLETLLATDRHKWKNYGNKG